MLIFEQSQKSRCITSQYPTTNNSLTTIPKALLRTQAPQLPAVSEMQVVRHYTRLSQKNFGIDTHFYPLGSCTMKYNPRVCNKWAMTPAFLSHHPATPESHSQGILACLYDLQEMLKTMTGMQAVSLAPAAGAHGEFAGVAMIKAYHQSRQDDARTEILIPDSAHGTNPASAVMCGYKVREVPTLADGDLDVEALKTMLGPQTAGIMLTNPSTLGVFERSIEEIAALVHEAGGLLYYDGANLNAILGKVRPGDMGFDVIHVNLHKTFSTPHGGGGPGAGPVGVSERLTPFLPVPMVDYDGQQYRWLTEADCPQTMGRLLAHAGNIGVLLRAYIYARLLGREGTTRIAEFATLNANYLMKMLEKAGFELAFPARRATHEFIVSFKRQAKEQHVNAMQLAKRLLDKGYHAPTTYFPLLIPECLLIEPTETEDKQTLDDFVKVWEEIQQEIDTTPDVVQNAPHTLPVKRLDDAKAAKMLDVVFED